MALGKLLLVIYFFTTEDSQRRAALHVGLSNSLVSSIYRRLQDVCSRDLQERPIIPFGGPGTVVKCDESKFNHKPKVTFSILFFLYITEASLSFHTLCFHESHLLYKHNNPILAIIMLEGWGIIYLEAPSLE